MLTYHHATTTCDLWYQPLGDGYCVGSRRAVSHTHTRRTPDYSFSGRVLSIEAGPELESALAEELTDNAPDAPTLAELAHYPPRTRMVSPASDRCLCAPAGGRDEQRGGLVLACGTYRCNSLQSKEGSLRLVWIRSCARALQSE